MLESQDLVLISAGTMADACMVATGRRIADDMNRLLDQLDIEIMPVTADSSRRIGLIYARWGRGFDPAGLNFGDCFAYELATSRNCPLLFVGDDFARTDVKRAL